MPRRQVRRDEDNRDDEEDNEAAGCGNNSTGAIATSTGISSVVIVRAQRPAGEFDTRQIWYSVCMI